MKHAAAAFLLTMLCGTMLSSCFLYRKIAPPTETTPAPPAPEETAPPETNPTEKEPQTARAPFHVPAFGQTVKKPVYDVALFTPLNLDAVLSDSGFSVSSPAPLPAATLSGLEFYEGALLAMDTLKQQGIHIRLYVYDTKSTSRPLARVLSSPEMDSADLILGSVNAAELQAISRVAKEKQINFVSATYPNDGGVRDNPFLTIVNSPLAVHCNAIQAFAQQKFSNQQIFVIYGNTDQEKRNLSYLQEAYRRMTLGRKVPLQPFAWTNNTTTADLEPKLSTQKTNVIILTALYPQVALSILGQLAPLAERYPLRVIGMPTLDGQAALKDPRYKGLSIYYSSPYPYQDVGSQPVMNSFLWKFFSLYRSRPSDMALKGFETLYYFGHLLQRRGMYFNERINDPSVRLMTAFDFQPVYTGSQSEPPDYFENRKLYFMVMRDGHAAPAN